jgi:para-aminobenzoate synthetase component 1
MTFNKLSELASQNIPFLFYTDFKGEKIHVYPLNELEQHGIEYAINQNAPLFSSKKRLQIFPISYKEYKKKFDHVIEKIKSGDTYLLNLTQPSKITTALSLQEIYEHSNAPYKLHVKGQFVCFSPEPFIKISNNNISTFPMKGTIDASVENAKKKILKNNKEMAEHVMVVDLLRNDLGMVAKDIRVSRFRYIQKINAGEKELLQVSSEINGKLDNDWKNRLGEIIKTLLPAGSVSGTPKKSTVKIIEEIETYERNYYTGIFGVYSENSLETSVMIRFIEKQDEHLIYKSGGGITLDSKAEDEYQELIDKVYIP